MITPKKILNNKVKMKSTIEKYKIFSDSLSDFLGEDFYTAPSSVSTDMYGCYPGGLVDTLLRMCKYSILVNETLPEPIKSNESDILKLCVLSQIGKTFLFKENQNEWQRKVGKIYEYNNLDDVVLRCGERSAFYCLTHGINLTEEEYQIIIDIDKDPSEKLFKYSKKPIHNILKIGFELAIIEEKNRETHE